MLTIGFFSKGTPYEDEARIFTASLDRVGMRYDVRGFTDRGTWDANTAAKAELIREARHSLPGPLLYIDVDARVRENCAPYFDGLAREGYDFGAHYFAGPPKGRNRKINSYLLENLMRGGVDAYRLLSGTLFLGDTKGCRKLCDNWVALNQTLRTCGVMHGGGQKNLWFMTTCMKNDLKIARLPGRYCRVFDKPWAYPPREPIVIEHSIASRENRGERGRVSPGRRREIEQWKTELGI